jgi:hypothetical protein
MAAAPGWKRHRFAVVLFATYAYFYQGADPNQHSRLFLTRALLFRHAINITADHSFTIDKSIFGDQFYSDKAPGLSVLAVPVQWMMTTVDRLFGYDDSSVFMQRAQLHFLTIVLCGLAGVAATLCVGRIVEGYGASARETMLCMVAYGLGTIVFPFSTALFAHQLAALMVLTCFLLVRQVEERPALLLRNAVLLGLVGSASITTEYPTGIIVGLCAGRLLLVQRAGWRTIALGGALGAAPLLLLHSLYLWKAFGSPLSLPYNHVFEPFFRVHHEEGLVGVNPPTLGGAFGVTLSSYRGLFFFCPHLLLVFFGFGYWLRSGEHPRDLRFVTLVVIAYFLFAASYYAWDGGGSTGPRHYLPALAFLSLPFFFFIRESRARFYVGLAFTAFSVFFMLVSTAVLVHQPEGEVLRSSPLYDTVLGSFFRGELALNPQDIRTLGPRFDASYNLGMFFGLKGLWSLLPLAALWVAAYSFEAARSLWPARAARVS